MIWGIRRYGIPFVLAALLHALAVAALYSGWNPTQTEREIIKPQIVKSSLLVLEPKAKPKPKPKPKAKPQPEARAQPEPQAEPKPKPVEAPKVDLEAQRREQAEAQRRDRLEALAESSFLDALESEASSTLR